MYLSLHNFNKNGQGLLTILLGIIVIILTFSSITLWLLNIENQFKNTDKKFDMMSLAYNQKQKIQEMSFRMIQGMGFRLSPITKDDYTVTTTFDRMQNPVPFEITVTSTDKSIPAYTINGSVSPATNPYSANDIKRSLDSVESSLNAIQKQIDDYYRDH